MGNFEFFNKRITTPIGIIIIVLVALLVGGIIVWQYWWLPKKEAEINLIKETLEKVKEIDSLKYQLLHFSEGNLISQQNIWRKEENGEEKVRNEVVPIFDESRAITMWDSSNDLFYVYSPERNTGKGGKINYRPNLEGSKGSLLEELENIIKYNPVIVGKETLDGKDCLIIRTIVNGSKIKHWVWIEYGLSIKSVAPVVTLDGEINTSQENEIKRENIEINTDLSDNLFELPAVVQITPFETVSNSTNSIQNWQNYRNEEYGFEIKYPESWILEEQGTYFLFYPSEESDVYPVQLFLWDNSEQLLIRRWVEKRISAHVILSAEEISEITINGNPVVKLTESGRIRLPKGALTKGYFRKESVYINYGTQVYNLNTVINHQYFYKMLSTFQFLE